MLEIKSICKTYETADFKQVALDKVSINFRKNEFASILGPSGSGKTTLLNIIGGLDHYDSGNLIINEVSTQDYKDRDWDSYRNHRVGFIFQSYNLITHQTILQNVELALTLSGISKSERKRRAKRVLKKVGLEKHINKKPNQLSGGQMQRVAIARALVNDPDILLADEPTGALDSVTSEQIMDLLKEVAKDKLVVMVTHNPELAQKYSTRIVQLKDGKIIDDTNPYDGDVNTKEALELEKKKSKKTSMNFYTALSLSFHNLLTKKGRTFLTAFAGSIGIIGIALILALSNGVQEYINKTQREALSSYPISIQETTTDMSSMIGQTTKQEDEIVCEENHICTTDDISNNPLLSITSSITRNNLKDFKVYLDQNGGNIQDYVTDIQYIYNIDLPIYSTNFDHGVIQVNPNTFSLVDLPSTGMSMNSYMFSTNVFSELLKNRELLNSQYEMLSGHLPENKEELVLVVDKNNQIPASLFYSLNLEDRKDLSGLSEQIKNGESVTIDLKNYTYDSIIGTTFKLVSSPDMYKKQNGIWVDYRADEEYMKSLIQNGMDLKIVGIMKIHEDSTDVQSGFLGYTHDLVEYAILKTNESALAKEQVSNPNINVFTGTVFDGIRSTYEANLQTLGIVSLESPSGVLIYPKDFESKDQIENIISEYNQTVEKENQITYTDFIGILLSSVTSIVNVISYILIAFVAVSLVVSSIMIAIITYISVLERTKEIGILRAIGASKKDVSRVFNAETVIEGFVAGLLGVFIAYLLTIPINAIVKSVVGVSNISHLKLVHAVSLILISVILNVISGLIPARIASKKDPVESLRSE